MQNQKRSKLNEITTIVLLCRDQLKITTDRIMTQQSQQPSATGPGAQSTSAPSQSVDFASPRPQGIIDLNFLPFQLPTYMKVLTKLSWIVWDLYLLLSTY